MIGKWMRKKVLYFLELFGFKAENGLGHEISSIFETP